MSEELNFKPVSEITSFPKTLEKAINFLKENKTTKRKDFWFYCNDEILAENILYSLHLEGKIKLENNDGKEWIIIWIGP